MSRCCRSESKYRYLIPMMVATVIALIAYQPSNASAYGVLVANNGDDSISVIDSQRPEAEPRVVENVGDGPTGLAYEQFSNSRSSVFYTLELDSRIRALYFFWNGNVEVDPFNQATGVRPGAVELDWDKLYIVNRGPNIPNPPNGSLSIVDASGQTPTIEVDVGVNPSGLAVSKLRNRIYVTNHDSRNISVIDIEQWSDTYGEVVDVIDLPPGTNYPSDIVRAFVGGTEYLFVANKSGVVTMINTETHVIKGTIPIPPAEPGGPPPIPVAIAAVENSETEEAEIFVASWGSNSVSIIDALIGLVVGEPIRGISNPTDIEVAEDGLAYISNQGTGSISILNTASKQIVGEVDVGNNPTGIAIFPYYSSEPTNPGCGETHCVIVQEPPSDPPIPPDNPKVPKKEEPEGQEPPIISPYSCNRDSYENRLKAPREARLKDLVSKKGLKVQVAASSQSTGTVKVEITGNSARQYKIFGKKARKKSKVLAKANVKGIGAGYKSVTLKARGKTSKAIKRALRLKRAPKATKLKVSLDSYSTANKRLRLLNTQTTRALKKAKPGKKGLYEKVRRTEDKTQCAKPLKAKISGPRDAKLKRLVTRTAKRGKGLKVKVSCSEDCKARVGIRLWGRYEVGLKLRKPGQAKNRWLTSRTVNLKGGKTKTLRLAGVKSKKLRKLLVKAAKAKRYKRIKFKYLIEARTPDGRAGAAAKTARVRMQL